MMVDEAHVAALADSLWQAAAHGVPIEPLTGQNTGLTVNDAYAIQSRNIDRRIEAGATVRGRKVGLTARTMQELLGVNEPDFGVLLDDMFVEDGDEIELASMLQPRVEAEMAFILGRDLAGPGVTISETLAAIAGVFPAIEIVDSRIADWRIQLVDTVADNASSGKLVVGGRMTPITDLDVRLTGMALTRNGELIDTGAGASALGNPVRCVTWLANKLGAFGRSLREGDVVLPGAVHRMVAVEPGDVFRAEFAHLGAVTVRFDGRPKG